jgi:hypothetical protein
VGSGWREGYFDCDFAEADDDIEGVGEEGVADVVAEEVIDLVEFAYYCLLGLALLPLGLLIALDQQGLHEAFLDQTHSNMKLYNKQKRTHLQGKSGVMDM